MTRLVVVSNRVAVGQGPRGDTGGLAVALRSALEKYGGVWFGWSGEVKQRSRLKKTSVPPIEFVTLDLRQSDYEEYYNGFANRALWPLLHYRLDLTAFERQDFRSYQRVNTLFARRLIPLLKPDDIIWIHDYHLMTLGSQLRQAGLKQKIGFFLHTPFPVAEILTALPPHAELVKALCSFDLIGFQTETDRRAFSDYIRFEAGGRALSKYRLKAFGREFEARAFPIGIDTDGIAKVAEKSMTPAVERRMDRQDSEFSWILGVDRLDYSKGIPERFKAYEHLLDKYPGYHGKVRYLQISPASRSEVPEYQLIRKDLESMAGRINGRFSQIDWVPLNYQIKSYAQQTLLGLYRSASVGLVTPLRDGMNLVAKEYVASQDPEDPGVLVLSRYAGAAQQLDAALIINPYDYDGTANAIARALDMPKEERIERWQSLMKVLRKSTLDQWQQNFLNTLTNIVR